MATPLYCPWPHPIQYFRDLTKMVCCPVSTPLLPFTISMILDMLFKLFGPHFPHPSEEENNAHVFASSGGLNNDIYIYEKSLAQCWCIIIYSFKTNHSKLRSIKQ